MNQKQVEGLEHDLCIIAGNRPFSSLTKDEKTDVVRKWAILKQEKASMKSPLDRTASTLIAIFMIILSLFGIAWALKMLFTVLGII